MRALFFGSIGTLAESSEMQRQAFNIAFQDAGLDWHWDKQSYNIMLSTSGGKTRIADHAERVGVSVDADALHRRKSEIFQDMMKPGRLAPRPGVVETIAAARNAQMTLGLVTTTSRANVTAVLSTICLPASSFDIVIHRGDVLRAKPAPDAYKLALSRLEVEGNEAVAIEDNPDGLRAAIAAGVPCIAVPGRAHVGAPFNGALRISEDVSPTDIF